MATQEAHCAETERALGKPYTEVHLWLDEFCLDKSLGASHRRKRHHEQEIQETIELFGEGAGLAVRMHIITDLKEEGWTERTDSRRMRRSMWPWGCFEPVATVNFQDRCQDFKIVPISAYPHKSKRG